MFLAIYSMKDIDLSLLTSPRFFTNIPLRKTVNIILKRIYKSNLVSTTLQKQTLKKLILDSCTKTVFSLKGQLYKQIDGVSMGSPFSPTLANIIMTEFENLVIRPLITSGHIKFYDVTMTTH